MIRGGDWGGEGGGCGEGGRGFGEGGVDESGDGETRIRHDVGTGMSGVTMLGYRGGCGEGGIRCIWS